LVENLQRQDLHYLEEARGISVLMEKGEMSQEQAARFLGKSQSAVANKLRILRHSPEVLELLQKSGLTERHARALLKIEDEGEKVNVIGEILRQNMSVAQTEKYIERCLSGQKEPHPPKKLGTFLNGITRYLQKMQSQGVPAITERRETDSQIVLTITIPKA
jgi:ParB family chromosome partitioning protein